mgnify:CR=1 FL=1
MHDRFSTLVATGTFGALLLTSSALASAPTKKVVLKKPVATTTDRHIPAPIAGILDGSNGETINVHGHHAAAGTGARHR